jgi:hypothetical protein
MVAERHAKRKRLMKKSLVPFVGLFFLISCSSPVLKWIDIPNGGSGRILGQSAEKEILSFSFGIQGETDVPFGKNPDSSGKIPIAVILPLGTDLRSLRPAITYIGDRLNPPAGEAGNFNSPVVYRVTAEDNSSRDYIVRVYVKDGASKAIVRFALDVSGTGGSAQTVEGIIDEAAGLITVSVPPGTDTKSLNAHVAHTGAMVEDPHGGFHPDEIFNFTGDFSAPAPWTVVAQDHTAKTYTVTVVREKSHDKAITHFSFGISHEEVVIGGEPQPDGTYPILALVPANTSLKDSKPFVSYTGISISPGPGTPLDFTVPEVYTVTAEDRSTRDYVVTVILQENNFSSLKQITGFYFSDPLVEGVIDEAAKTIALTVPQGTNLGALRPEIYYTGASVSPLDGQPKDFTNPVVYTVRARDGTTQPYTVSVFLSGDPVPPKIDVPATGGEKVTMGADGNGNIVVIVELPVYIINPTININYGGGAAGTETKTINNDNVYNLISTGDNNEYNIIIINPPADASSGPAANAASIDGFYFTAPVAVGSIGKTDGTEGTGTPADPYRITVTVPWGTDLRNLAATICYTGKEIAGIPGPNPLKDNGRSFTGPVDYTVNAADGTAAKTYRVRVTAALNNAKEISAFSFNGIDTSAVISAVPNAEGKYPITVTVPQGQSLSGLSPVITHTGVSVTGSSVSGPGTVTGSSANFSSSPSKPVDYTVTAEDGGTKTYAVTVRNAAPLEDDIEITGFYFTEPLVVGTINQATDTITVAVPSKTDRTALKPVVYFKGMSVKPASGAVNDFSGPVTYTVIGNSGKTRPYTVMVNSSPSAGKDITRFTFPGIPDSETIIGALPDPDGSYPVSVWVPAGTDLDNRGPDITYTGVSITPDLGSSLNFNTPQTYTVTAEDGSVKTYKVRVGTQSGDTKVITSFIFEEVPVTGGTDRVAASVNQSTYTITAEVPFTADLSQLRPTLTYIGKSIAGPSGGDKTANPYTDAPRDFSNNQIYTVKDRKGAGQFYVVTVIRKSSVTVQFEGETEKDIIVSKDFNQTTGVFTVTVNTANVNSPYEWYLDGVKQPVSNTEAVFTLNVGNGTFTPGKHEIMVSGQKDGLHYTGKAYFTVSGDTK